MFSIAHLLQALYFLQFGRLKKGIICLGFKKESLPWNKESFSMIANQNKRGFFQPENVIKLLPELSPTHNL